MTPALQLLRTNDGYRAADKNASVLAQPGGRAVDDSAAHGSYYRVVKA